MKTLYLLRHAKSSWKDQGQDDFDRPLNKRGEAAAAAMGKYMAQQNLTPAHVLCSSAVRTRETLERVQAGLGPAVPVRYEKGVYSAEAPALLRRLKRLSDSLASVMLVGHNPSLANLALLLAREQDDDGLRSQIAAKFPTGSLATIEADVDRWANLVAGCGRLIAFVKPRDLEHGKSD